MAFPAGQVNARPLDRFFVFDWKLYAWAKKLWLQKLPNKKCTPLALYQPTTLRCNAYLCT